MPSKRDKKDTRPPPPPVPSDWDRCHAYLIPKSRYCRQMCMPSTLFCGTHGAARNSNASRKRIPCPIDPSHDVYEDLVHRHVKKCPRTKLNQQQESLPCYRKDYNAGGGGTTPTETPVGTTWLWAEQVALAVLRVHQDVFASSDTYDDVCALSHEDIVNAIPLDDASSNELSTLAHSLAASRVKSGGPLHQHQQASLLGHWRKRRCCSSSDITVLELGAGRGIAGLVVASCAAANSTDKSTTDNSSTATPTTRLIMVERDSPRHGADKWLRQGSAAGSSSVAYMNMAAVKAERIRCDLAHVDMAKVLSAEDNDDKNTSSSSSLVIVAKHLCGAGTDLALASLLRVPMPQQQHASLLMSTCCHGVCNWKDYVGRHYLSQAMEKTGLAVFGSAEFELLRRWSTGSCKPHESPITTPPGEKEAADEHNNAHDYSSEGSFPLSTIVQRLKLQCKEQGLGRACQRVVDYGRREFIHHELGFRDEASVVYSVPIEVTIQNALLVGQRKATRTEETATEQGKV